MRETAGTTAQRLSARARLVKAGQSSPLMDRTLDDRTDFVEWATLLWTRENLVRRLELLAGGNGE